MLRLSMLYRAIALLLVLLLCPLGVTAEDGFSVEWALPLDHGADVRVLPATTGGAALFGLWMPSDGNSGFYWGQCSADGKLTVEKELRDLPSDDRGALCAVQEGFVLVGQGLTWLNAQGEITQPSPAWCADLAFVGAVMGERIFAVSESTLYCMEADTGALLWQTEAMPENALEGYVYSVLPLQDGQSVLLLGEMTLLPDAAEGIRFFVEDGSLYRAEEDEDDVHVPMPAASAWVARFRAADGTMETSRAEQGTARCGYQRATQGSDGRVILIRVEEGGAEEVQCYDPATLETPLWRAVLKDDVLDGVAMDGGGYLLTTYTGSQTRNGFDEVYCPASLTALSADGDLLWTQPLPEPANGGGHIVRIGDGAYLVSAGTFFQEEDREHNGLLYKVRVR